MDAISVTFIILFFVIAWNGHGWITAIWEGKAEVAREERKTAEARAREAEARATQARIEANHT